MSNFVYIAVSLDGYIARSDGSIDWLNDIGDPEGEDYGYKSFIDKIDAIVMGRHTFDLVRTFDKWPYKKPVYALSNSLKSLEQEFEGKAQVTSKSPVDLVDELHNKGCLNLYIDGGKTIQSFLKSGLIDEIIITRVPILIGSGIPLFGYLERDLRFEHINTIVYNNGLVKSHYKKK